MNHVRKETVFISYCSEDKMKMKSLFIALEKSAFFQPLVADRKKQPSIPLENKVMFGIDKSTFFIPILTQNSISSQWVNQEIGYAKATRKEIIPIADKDILVKLKGFIHKDLDIPFQFASNQDKTKETKSYRKCYKELVLFLESIRKELNVKIEPIKVKRGDSFTTKVEFRGALENGFFDNFIRHINSGFSTWNWDPNTLPDDISTTPGDLTGNKLFRGEWKCDTTNFPLGLFNVHVRVYDHPVPGQIYRKMVAEKIMKIEVEETTMQKVNKTGIDVSRSPKTMKWEIPEKFINYAFTNYILNINIIESNVCSVETRPIRNAFGSLEEWAEEFQLWELHGISIEDILKLFSEKGCVTAFEKDNYVKYHHQNMEYLRQEIMARIP